MSLSRLSLGDTPLQFSRMAMGFWRQNSWNKSSAELSSFVHELVDLGVTTMDHAYVYRSEPEFGRVLKASPSLRQKIEIVGKFGILPPGFGAFGAQRTKHYNTQSDYLLASVNQSLRDLNTDYLDVLLVHRPDYLCDVHQLAEDFRHLQAQGKVRFFGVSNFSCAQVDALQVAMDGSLLTNQVECSPMHLDPLDNGVFDQCMRDGMHPMLWSCLAGGALLDQHNPVAARLQDALTALAAEYRHLSDTLSLETLVYAWLLRLPCKPVPILGSGHIERIKHALLADSIHLTPEQWYFVLEAIRGDEVP